MVHGSILKMYVSLHVFEMTTDWATLSWCLGSEWPVSRYLSKVVQSETLT